MKANLFDGTPAKPVGGVVDIGTLLAPIYIAYKGGKKGGGVERGPD